MSTHSSPLSKRVFRLRRMLAALALPVCATAFAAAGGVSYEIGLPAGVAVAQAAASTLTPVKLRCEYLETPLGLDIPAPRFSWVLEGAAGDTGKAQSGYRIYVQEVALNGDAAAA
ncbi:MAG: hypothetical protein LBR07_08280, partial [Puniceicoccales bacterium]|nr:hypothetical protein [Puniceicoccales bacterium]